MFSTKDTGRSPRILTFRPSRPSLCSSDCELRWHLPRIELHLGEKEKTKENAEGVSGTVLVPRAYGWALFATEVWFGRLWICCGPTVSERSMALRVATKASWNQRPGFLTEKFNSRNVWQIYWRSDVQWLPSASFLQLLCLDAEAFLILPPFHPSTAERSDHLDFEVGTDTRAGQGRTRQLIFRSYSILQVRVRMAFLNLLKQTIQPSETCLLPKWQFRRTSTWRVELCWLAIAGTLHIWKLGSVRCGCLGWTCHHILGVFHGGVAFAIFCILNGSIQVFKAG